MCKHYKLALKFAKKCAFTLEPKIFSLIKKKQSR